MARPRPVRFARGRSAGRLARFDFSQGLPSRCSNDFPLSGRLPPFCWRPFAMARRRRRTRAAVDLGAPDAVIELKEDLTPYHTPAGQIAGGRRGTCSTPTNASQRPAVRVLLAGQPPEVGLRFFPAIVAALDPERGEFRSRRAGRDGARLWPSRLAGDDSARRRARPRDRDGQCGRAAVAAGLDRAGARRAQPPARNLHHRRRGSDLAAAAITGGLAVMTATSRRAGRR